MLNSVCRLVAVLGLLLCGLAACGTPEQRAYNSARSGEAVTITEKLPDDRFKIVGSSPRYPSDQNWSVDRIMPVVWPKTLQAAAKASLEAGGPEFLVEYWRVGSLEVVGSRSGSHGKALQITLHIVPLRQGGRVPGNAPRYNALDVLSGKSFPPPARSEIRQLPPDLLPRG